MINLYYFTDMPRKIALRITLDTHHIFHINCKLTNKQNYSEIEIRYVNKVSEDMTTIYAK